MRDTVLTWISEFPQDDVHVAVAPATAECAREDLPPNVEVHALRTPQHGLAVLFELPFLARRLQADTVLTQNFAPLWGPRADVFVHDLMFVTHPDWFTRLERTYFRALLGSLCRARTILTSSETEAGRIRQVTGRRASDVAAVGLGVGRDLAAAPETSLGLAVEPYSFLLTVGRLNVRKNLNLAIEAALASGRATPQHPLVVVGERQGKHLKFSDRTNSAVRDGQVIFAGGVDDSGLAWLYRHCSGFVFPTLDEGFGLPVIEAAYYGAPAIVSDIAVLREVGGPAVTLLSPHDETAAADALSRFPLRRSGDFDAESRRLALERYSWAATVNRIRGHVLAAEGGANG